MSALRRSRASVGPTARPPRASPAACALLALVAAAFAGCFRGECSLNSDCPRGTCAANVCTYECRADRDCTRPGQVCNDNGRCVSPGGDAGLEAGADVVTRPDVTTRPDTTQGPDIVVTPMDVVVTPTDVVMPPTDVPVTGRGAYLDGCTSDGECASGMCATGVARFCTRTCGTRTECANGQNCIAGRCVLDDTGRTGCDPTTASPCLQYCLGSTSSAHCTRDCTSGGDCPAGFACSPVAPGRQVCVAIEQPCTTPDQCPSGLGFCGAGMVGCTALCRTAADCPLRLVGLPPYACEVRSGQQVCIPPADVLGADALGTVCSATGTNTCRSGGCDSNTSPPTCNQRCSPLGGCPQGFGCYPLADGADVLLVCIASGTAWLGQTCGRARDCLTGLCSQDRYCTRMCNDGLCPTGMFCRDTGLAATDGSPIRLCSR